MEAIEITVRVVSIQSTSTTHRATERAIVGALMGPIGLTCKSGKDFQIIHRCARCGIQRVNVIARDARQADDDSVWIALSTPSV